MRLAALAGDQALGGGVVQGSGGFGDLLCGDLEIGEGTAQVGKDVEHIILNGGREVQIGPLPDMRDEDTRGEGRAGKGRCVAQQSLRRLI